MSCINGVRGDHRVFIGICNVRARQMKAPLCSPALDGVFASMNRARYEFGSRGFIVRSKFCCFGSTVVLQIMGGCQELLS